MCCGRRAIPMALRPPLSIKRAGATANSLIIERARPACRGPGAVDNVISTEAGGYCTAEVGCGIELSPCSAACPSGTIYTSFRPNICVGLLSGTSAAPLCRLASRPSSDLQIR
ncbi:hypothetical protein THAOC_12030 [Thalassiosira oceanica]|uniref:Uncharacterized protein n=1 Tax=Thalassiosira oceanica TaxID=159749 RepID=K0SNN8_THAOC|nr:hypothetical protein THAOC_12030 [Thalassiosira oceanica]|eukprot:EJK66990.1 hypothetical protein THAOC_12030 [Thalassiosira oceanica]